MRQHLSIRERHFLGELALKEFTASKLNLLEFAEYATKTLGFNVTRFHLRSVLEAFEIPTHTTPASPEAAAIEALEKRVVCLEKRLDVYFGVAK